MGRWPFERFLAMPLVAWRDSRFRTLVRTPLFPTMAHLMRYRPTPPWWRERRAPNTSLDYDNDPYPHPDTPPKPEGYRRWDDEYPRRRWGDKHERG